MRNKLKKAILKGEFNEGLVIIRNYSIPKLWSFLSNFIVENKDIMIIGKEEVHRLPLSIYSFIWFLIEDTRDKKIKSEYHGIISELLTLDLNTFHHAESLAVFHAREALKLDRRNIKLKNWFLSLFRMPDTKGYISKEEAIKTAKEVLRKKPNSKIAREILELTR